MIHTPQITPEIAIEEIDNKTGKKPAYKKEVMKRVRLIGLVTSVRQVQTKTGKMMAIATCDSFDFKFTVLVFSKEYEALSPLLEEDKILLVEGIFRGNEENGEMAVTAQTIRASTITSIRQQANDMNLFDSAALVNLSGFTEELAESIATVGGEVKKEGDIVPETKIELSMEPDIEEIGESDEEENMTEKIELQDPLQIEEIQEYSIIIPSSACRQDLVDLKTFLESVPKGSIQIYIDIQ